MKLIHEIIADYAVNNPARKAAEDSFGSLSYGELHERSNNIAQRLAGLGLRAGDSVGVYVPYVKDVITGALSVWKAGGIYVPMDNAYPVERLEYILKDSDAKAILTCRTLWEDKALNFPADKVIFLDEIADGKSDFTHNPEITPKSPAMLLYTSGTTGNPKGVLHRHEFLTHIVDWMNASDDFAMTNNSHIGLISRFTFVATVILMFGGLLNGGTLYFAPENAMNDLERLYHFITDKRISHIFIASSLAAIFAEDYDISGVNVFAFTETDGGIFIVNRKQIDIDLEVVFDPCGGDLDVTSATFKLGAQYSTLPKPTMAGHTFAGWFTEAEDGVKVEATDRCKTGVEKLYAHWEVYVDPFVDAICAARNLTFFSEGDSPWFVDGDGVARSGSIGDNGSTSLTTTVQGAGTLSFRWRTSSEGSYDCLRVRVDGSETSRISGDGGWLDFSLPVSGTGSHTVEWVYTKDGSVSNGEDCGWIDDVVWSPAEG